MTRRRFLLGALALAPFVACADAAWLEPEWVRVRRIKVGTGTPTARLVHITDIHHKGDTAYLESVVRQVNKLQPDVVCFTGDIVEEHRYLTEALAILAKVKAPIYGSPGNHDYWSGADFGEIQRSLTRGGGAWLLDAQRNILDGKICLTGATCLQGRPVAPPPRPGVKNILLAHYPIMADRLRSQRFDLILAGHSHGGQVRIPFFGAVVVPYWVGRYEMGWFETAGGPLYVNPGIGYLVTRVRFCCRPEITVFDV
ncbi:MAG TPA: metallophosphoesterase [Verrucomicrobiae bacterium]|nr:metallophosphoesterase [Verrucomicrobiae bacterium]